MGAARGLAVLVTAACCTVASLDTLDDVPDFPSARTPLATNADVDEPALQRGSDKKHKASRPFPDRAPVPLVSLSSTPHHEMCSDACEHSGNGECEDGSLGATSNQCAVGTDCSDCGIRIRSSLTSSSLSPLPSSLPWPSPSLQATVMPSRSASPAMLPPLSDVPTQLAGRRELYEDQEAMPPPPGPAPPPESPPMPHELPLATVRIVH